VTQPTFAHYRMTEGDIECSPGQAEACIAYLIEDGLQNRLCVIEGGAFHTFNISPQGLARLAEESTKQLRKHLVAGP
jgi:hypothetical protein